MRYLLSVLATITIAAIVLMVGLLLLRNPKQSLRNAIIEGAAWGGFLFVSFLAETLVLIAYSEG